MKGKIIVPLLLASLSAGVVATQQQQTSVFADASTITNVVGDLVEISNYESTGSLGENVYLPDATAFDDLGNPTGVALNVKVVDPSGRTLTNAEILNDANGDYFVPKMKGYYSVSFETAAGETQVTTASNTLKIYIAGQDYAISLPENSKYVIPATIPVSTTNALKIQAPSVSLDGEELEMDELIQAGGEGLQVFVLNKDGSGDTTALSSGALDADGNYVYSWMPETAGIYEIVYKYVDGTVQDYTTQRFVVSESYDASEIDLSFSYASSRPSTATLGTETTLPEINIVDDNTGNSIEGYTSILVEHVATGTVFEVSDDYKFVPTLAGTYRVTYQAQIDYFGVESNTHSFLIEQVKDTTAPSVLPVNNYTVDANGDVATVLDADDNVIYDASNLDAELTDEEKEELLAEAMSSVSYNIPSVVALTTDGETSSATVSLPAIYGLDSVSDLGDITFKRSVRRSSTGVVSEITDAEAYETASYTFTSAGSYTIRYIATDAEGNQKMTSYDITVVSSVADLKDEDTNEYLLPTITMQALSSYVKGNATIVFNAPTATDEYDTRVEVKTYYSFDADATEHEITTKNDSGQIELDLASITIPVGATELYVTAKAYNDYAVEVDGVTRQFASVTRTVKLINTNDADMPEFVDVNDFLVDLADANGIDTVTSAIGVDGYLYVGVDNEGEPFDQGDSITLPEVVITDDTDPNLTLSVSVKDPFGKTVSVSNSQFTSDIGALTNTYTIGEGTFAAIYSGLYTVTYTAKDAGGNLIVKTFGLRVRDTEKPTISLSSFDPFTSEMEVGEFIEVPAANLIDNGVIVEDLTYGYQEAGKAGISWRLENSSNVNVVNGIGFTPLAAGEYVVIYEGWDAEGNTTESKAYTVVVADTTDPTIELENDLYLSSGVPYVENEAVTLPGVVELYDGYRDEDNADNNYDQTDVADITFSVKVSDSNGNNMAVTEDEQTNSAGVPITRYLFTPSGDGVYTITYTAVDTSGNTTTVTKTLEVGDVEAPELVWEDDYEVISSATIGETFELNMAKASITDDEDEYDDIDISVVMYDPDDNVVTSLVTGGYKWEFEETGTYSIKVVLTDSANNTQTYTYNIEVSEEDAEENVIAPWLGTTLIVATGVILAGVVVYFVVTSKGGKPSASRKRRAKK